MSKNMISKTMMYKLRNELYGRLIGEGLIENIGDKIDFENIMKDAFAYYKKQYYVNGANKTYLRYQMSRINEFLKRTGKVCFLMPCIRGEGAK